MAENKVLGVIDVSKLEEQLDRLERIIEDNKEIEIKLKIKWDQSGD